MALKSDRHLFYDDIRYFCNDVAERGVILVHSGSGTSGNYLTLDNTDSVAMLPGTGSVSGLVPVGLLLNDMVDLDETRYRLNPARDEMRVGSKCHLLKKGWVITDQLKSGDTPKAGDDAYLAPSGKISTTSTNAAKVGKFKGRKDASNFVLLEVDIQ